MNCSNCGDSQAHIHRLIGENGQKDMCSACIVMDNTEYEKANCYTELRDSLREKHSGLTLSEVAA